MGCCQVDDCGQSGASYRLGWHRDKWCRYHNRRLGGGALAYHYHRRITGAWRDADRVAAYFREAGIDFSKIIPGYRAPEMYDTEELSILGSIIVLSILPALLAWLVSMAS